MSSGCKEQDAKGSVMIHAVPVEVQTIKRQSIQRQIQLSGSVMSGREVQIRAQIAGDVVRRYFDVGTQVKAKQTLALIDQTPYQAMLQQAQGTQARIQAIIRRTELSRNIAQSSYKRTDRLYRMKGVPIAQLDQVKNQLHQSEAGLAEAQASLLEAQAAVRIAQWRLEHTRIRAAFAGTITQRFVEKGGYIGPGTPIATVASLHPARLEIGISALDLPLLDKEQLVDISVDAYPNRSIKGKIERVGHQADPYSRAYPVDIAFDNPQRDIRPGMLARVTLNLGSQIQAIIIPPGALIQRHDQHTVFLVDRDKARLQQVVRGSLYRDWVIIEQGLQSGDQLIVIGQHNLSDGRSIRIIRNLPPTPDGSSTKSDAPSHSIPDTP
jgi:RND family efflux transporter MFP subunit